MGIGMIAVLVIAVVLIVILVRSMTQQTQTPVAGQYVPAAGAQYGVQSAGPAQTTMQTAVQAPFGPVAAETPRDIVQRRYANGEIDREEYVQKLADL